MSEEKLVRFTVSMPEPLRTKLKAKCVLQGTTMNETIVRLVEEWTGDQSHNQSHNQSPK